MTLDELTTEQRHHVAAWAIKTSRTEEWTGGQVMRLLALDDEATTRLVGTRELILQQAREELNHAHHYAQFAHHVAGREWCADYAARKKNFVDASFTQILRSMDALPLPHVVAATAADARLVQFMVRLLYLDYAGLLTVGVYQESPYRQLQDIAFVIHQDEGRHVQVGLAFARKALNDREGRRMVHEAARAAWTEVSLFFGGDESPTQRTLQQLGIRRTKNAELKETFRRKISALLEVEL